MIKKLREVLEFEEMKNFIIMCIFSFIIIITLLLKNLVYYVPFKSISIEYMIIGLSFIFVLILVFIDCSRYYLYLKNQGYVR